MMTTGELSHQIEVSLACNKLTGRLLVVMRVTKTNVADWPFASGNEGCQTNVADWSFASDNDQFDR